MPRVLLVGGAPRVAVDAVRHLTVQATGTTAVTLGERLGGMADLLLSRDAVAHPEAARFADRAQLESALQQWIALNPTGTVVMSAAVNDYQVSAVERITAGVSERLAPGAKAASGADELVIRLRPADKLIDRLRPEFGLRGRLIGFKYEDRATVLAAAQALQRRVAADLVIANSLGGDVQSLVWHDRHEAFLNRAALLDVVARWLATGC